MANITQAARQRPAGQSPWSRYQLRRWSRGTSASRVAAARPAPRRGSGRRRRSRRKCPCWRRSTAACGTRPPGNTPHARCISNSLEPQNQPSLVRFTSTSGASPCRRQGVDLAADDVREHGLVADVRCDANSVPIANAALNANAAALSPGVALTLKRRKPVQPGQVLGKRHVLAEHHQVHLVVAAAQFPVGDNENGRVAAC